jgi:tryptophan halogenase
LKIAVVGGGAGGYLAALIFKQKYPEYEVTVVDSSKIGILGAGEGTTPVFHDTLVDLNISIQDFVKETKATIKNGIKFIGWGLEKDFYFHSFENKEIEIDFLNNKNNKNSLLSHTIINDTNLDSINIQAQSSYNNSVFTEKHAWHVDARLLAIFLNKESASRGINIIDGVVDEIFFNELNEIESLSIDKKIFSFDFYIDSSGFKRLIIGNHYGAEWVNTSNALPCDSALAFFMYDQEPMMHTEAIAMDYGWSWRIPLQHRFGCGYVYDSKYITKDEAIKEVKNKFGDNVEIVNHFNFNSGYYKTPLVKNCLAIGLSSSFFEPLEATAIHSSIIMCRRFIKFYFDEYIKNKNQEIANKYNDEISTYNEDLLAFLYFHYTTNKKNTDFWKNFVTNIHFPEKTKKYLNKINNDFFSKELFKRDDFFMFPLASWITVYAGNELYIKDNLRFWLDNLSEQEYNRIIKEIQEKNINISLDDYVNNLQTKKAVLND